MAENPPKAQPPEDSTSNMSFLEHLEELRWHILKGLSGFVVGIIVATIFGDFLVDKVMLGPTQSDFFVYKLLGIEAIDLTIQSRKLPGQFFTYWGTLIVFGAILGSPIFFYQLWGLLSGISYWSRLRYNFSVNFKSPMPSTTTSISMNISLPLRCGYFRAGLFFNCR